MPRKTIEIAYVVEKGNYFLAHSEDEQREQRLGVCSMIELALHKYPNNYGGYLHLETAEIQYEAWHSAWEVYHLDPMAADTPRWSDFCKDDTRRAYMMKGQPYPNTRVAEPTNV